MTTKTTDIMTPDNNTNEMGKKVGRNGLQTYNLERVMELLNMAKGERSFREYALDAGVSAANLYRIKKNDYKPSPQMLKTLTSDKAAPRGNVTFEDLMIAAGYQEKNSIELAREDMAIGEDNSEELPLRSRDRATLEERRKLREEMRARRKTFEMAATGLIYKGMTDANIEFSHLKTEDMNNELVLDINPDILVGVNHNGIKKWWIEFFYIDDHEPSRESARPVRPRRGRLFFRRYSEMLFGRLMLLPPKADRKITVVLNNSDFYEYMAKFKDLISYRGDLSIVLVDIDSLSILEETYLSHYVENETDTEFCL